MARKAEGVVWGVYAKTYRGQEEYTIKLDGIDCWFRCKTDRYAGIAEKGNKIEFMATEIDATSALVEKGSVKLAQAPAPVAASGTPAAAATGGSYGDRNNSIVYQSSRKDALEFVSLLLAHKALKVPAKQAALCGAIETALDRYTALFFNDVGTLGAVVREAEGTPETAESEESEDDGE